MPTPRLPFSGISPARPIVAVYNAGDCRTYGAASAAQSLNDLTAWAAAWGFTDVRLLPFTFPNQRTLSFSDYTGAGSVFVASGPYAGQSFYSAIFSLASALGQSNVGALICSTYTPAQFNRSTGSADNFACLPGAMLSAFNGSVFEPTSLIAAPQYTNAATGYSAFTTTPKNLPDANVAPNRCIPTGRLGFPDITVSTIAEVAVDPAIVAATGGPVGETLTAYCTRTSLLSRASTHWTDPHIVVPTAQFGNPPFDFIPAAANALQASWLAANGVTTVNPGTAWSTYGNDATRILRVLQASAAGAPMSPSAWNFVTYNTTSYAFVGGTTWFDSTTGVAYDTATGVYTLPAPAFSTTNFLGFDAIIAGTYYTFESGAYDIPFSPVGTMTMRIFASVPPSSTVALTRASLAALPSYRIDAYSLYVGYGTVNGSNGLSPGFFPADNFNWKIGSHAQVWQSGNGYWLYKAFQRGLCAAFGSPGGPTAEPFAEPQEFLRNLMLTGASMMETMVATVPTPQAFAPNAYLPNKVSSYGDPMHAPYFKYSDSPGNVRSGTSGASMNFGLIAG